VPVSVKSRSWSRLSRAGLVAALIALSIALLGIVWASNQNVRAAMRPVLRGEASTLYTGIRDKLQAEPDKPVAARLAAAMADLEDEHLRYVAVVNPSAVEAEAGVGALSHTELLAWAKTASPGVPQLDGERARVFYRRPRSIGGTGATDAPAGDGIVLELHPRIAHELADSGTRTLVIGILAALTLIGLTVVLVRWSLGRERVVRQLEADRHLAHLGQMSAVLAHEIRNPLASLKGNAQLLAAGITDDDRAKAKAMRVVDEATRLETLTNDLLEFARVGTLHVAEVDPGELARDAAAIGNGRVRLAVDDAPRTWALDPVRMRQVLVNLVENAIELSEAPVEVGVAKVDRDLVITVADRGPGIPEGDLDKVFEPFFTRRVRGTGLGLAVARRFVELHGGKIHARARDGGGTTFEVVVPRR
jgi:two-component system, NtrC family, sensor histidine kinase HydH